MTTANLFGKITSGALSGTPINWPGDTFKVALLTASYVPSLDTHDFFNDVSAFQVTGTGYTSGGFTVSNPVVKTFDPVRDETTYDADDLAVAAVTYTGMQYAVLYKDTGTPSTSPLMVLFDFVTPSNATAQPFSLVWPATGVFTLRATAQTPAEYAEASAVASAATATTAAVAAVGATANKVDKGSLVRNVRDYGAVGDGVTDDTPAFNAMLLETTGEFYAGDGVFLVGDLTKNLTLRKFRGAGQDRTIFKAKPGATRVLDFRESYKCVLEDFMIDGNGTAAVGLDLGTTTVGASSGNTVNRVHPKNCTDRGYDMTNNGDTVMHDCHAGPMPDTATICYWPNSGGNTLIYNPKWFGAGSNPGPTRAALECSFQNLYVSGGGMVGGIQVLDGGSSQNMYLAGGQYWAKKDGGNINGTTGANAGPYVVDISGATKLAVVTSTQSYFNGNFRIGIRARTASFNSGCTSGTPNAFGASFVADGATKLGLSVEDCILRNESGANVAVWNDTLSSNVETFYRNFFGPTMRNRDYVVRAGDGSTTGQGLVVGGGIVIKKMDSTTLTWDPPSIAAGGYTSSTFTWTGVVPGQWIGASPAVDLGDGVLLYATITISGSVRLTIQNLTGSAVDLASMTIRLYRTQIV